MSLARITNKKGVGSSNGNLFFQTAHRATHKTHRFESACDDLPALQQAYRAPESDPLVPELSAIMPPTGASERSGQVALDTTAEGMAQNSFLTMSVDTTVMPRKPRIGSHLGGKENVQSPHQTGKSSSYSIPRDRLRDLTAGLRRHAPVWADRLSNARSDQDILDIVTKLFDLSIALTPSRGSSTGHKDLAAEISRFINHNLRKGLTLKLLATFLGYSEKYCSEVFRSVMGESFSRYLKRRRIEVATALLRTTDSSLSEIALALGFSDQFAFSHFFKRSTGRSPRDVRADRARLHPRRASFRMSRGLE
ncbi:MAG: helix-turn-helix transcriptional regulator [Nitrospira sp.]|nr:helix-turn-helix transcriptional regulator [Nitrospira sp.]